MHLVDSVNSVECGIPLYIVSSLMDCAGYYRMFYIRHESHALKTGSREVEVADFFSFVLLYDINVPKVKTTKDWKPVDGC